MEEKMHHVDFHSYCSECKHKKLKETEYPCSICLGIGARLSSRRPKYFEEEKK